MAVTTALSIAVTITTGNHSYNDTQESFNKYAFIINSRRSSISDPIKELWLNFLGKQLTVYVVTYSSKKSFIIDVCTIYSDPIKNLWLDFLGKQLTTYVVACFHKKASLLIPTGKKLNHRCLIGSIIESLLNTPRSCC